MIERARDCRSELVARASRGRLSQAENLALQAHLAGCALCRLSRQVLADFGEMNAIDHHDDVRIERLSDVARGWTQGRARPRRRWRRARRIRFLAFAGGIALLAGTASAAIWLRHKPPQLAATPEAPRPAADRAAARTRVASVGAERPTAVASEPPARRREARALPESARPTPALLLRRAGDAQRAGEPETALALYRQLRRDHAASPEASLATVPLGRLLLDRSPRAALAEFDSYLRASPTGALVPEALYGRARALGVLGDAAGERQTWQRLLGGFPDSAYVPVGRRRLAELR